MCDGAMWCDEKVHKHKHMRTYMGACQRTNQRPGMCVSSGHEYIIFILYKAVLHTIDPTETGTDDCPASMREVGRRGGRAREGRRGHTVWTL